MYVRLAFSVAAHLEPDILIVDEVLSVGDAEFQKKSLGKMHSVSREGRTVLFVSHNMAAVRTICNRAVVLRDGHLIFDGFPEAAIPYYVGAGYADASEFVRDPSLSYHKLFFKRITLRDSSGQRRANFVAGEDISVEVEVVVNESGADRELALELLNNEGVTLFTRQTMTKISGGERSLQPGTYLAVCVINTANIRPGQYVISLSSSKPGVEMFDEVPGAVGFQLDPAPGRYRSSAWTKPARDDLCAFPVDYDETTEPHRVRDDRWIKRFTRELMTPARTEVDRHFVNGAWEDPFTISRTPTDSTQSFVPALVPKTHG